MAENVEDAPEYQDALAIFMFRYGIPTRKRHRDQTDRVMIGSFKEGFVAGWNAGQEDA